MIAEEGDDEENRKWKRENRNQKRGEIGPSRVKVIGRVVLPGTPFGSMAFPGKPKKAA